MSEENKALVRRMVEEAQSRGNVEAEDEFLAENVVDHSAFPGFAPTREGVKQLFSLFHTAFEDFHATIHDQVGEGRKVATRKTLHGTHRGEFLGVPPTGKRATIEVTDILYVEEGRITDHWTVVNQLGLMRQLGVIPEPGHSEEASPT
jgi:steroid delta-isomerase-like uncharacterized protein